MKTTDFIVENSQIAQEAAVMHQDHEVQMARADCYNAADYAIQIHRMLKHISEQEGIEGWVSEKITSANNALRDVAEYLRYEKQDEQQMMEFVYEAAEYALGKLVAEEGYKDWSEKNPGKLNQQTADMYARNTHRWGGDTGVPGAKEHGGKDDLKTVDRKGNPTSNLATRIEKPEGVPKVSKKPITSFGGGVGRTGGTMDPSAVKSLVPNFESKQRMSRAAKGHEKYGKAGMQALAKAGREGASEKELDAIRDKHDNYNKSMKQGVAEGLNEFAPGSGGGESGRWYTDDQMTDIVGDGWWQDMDVSGANIGVPDGDVPKQYMIQQAQAWLDDQGYSVQVLNCKVNDDDMEWFIEGNFRNPGFAKKSVAEARNGDTNFGSTVGHGSWVVYDGSKVKRFKSRDGAKAYAEKNGGKVASSEHYADNIQGKQAVKENASAGASSAGGVAVSMGGPGHKTTTGVPKRVGNAHKSKKVTVGKGIY